MKSRTETSYKNDGNNPSNVLATLGIPYEFFGNELHPSKLCKDVVYDTVTGRYKERDERTVEHSRHRFWHAFRPIRRSQ